MHLLALVMLLPILSAAPRPDATAPSRPAPRAGYAVGVQLMRGLQAQGLEVDLDSLVRGLRDAHAGGPLERPEGEVLHEARELEAALRRRRALHRRLVGLENEKAGEAFLAGFREREDVVTLPSGVGYRVLKAGAGSRPTVRSTVEVAYTGRLVDGTEFDGSPRDGGPAVLAVADLVPGWREALQLMQTGSRWEIVVPSRMAYGQRGGGDRIAPGATLVFDVELLAVR